MPYIVTYASAGCLPDGEPDVFETLQDAVGYIWHEYQDVRGIALTDGVDTMAASPLDIADDMGADDPRPGSLYRWTIEQVAAVCDHCDGEGTEIVMGPNGYENAPCSFCQR